MLALFFLQMDEVLIHQGDEARAFFRGNVHVELGEAFLKVQRSEPKSYDLFS